MQKRIIELQPCLSAKEICQEPLLQPYLIQLKQLVSAPTDTYQELYVTTLQRFMEFCQAMPFDIQQPKPYSLLQKQLDLAITALKLRRGKMLPLHSESETIAEQEPMWTFALFTACLFANINRLQYDRCIELYLSAGEKIGIWSVIAGNLYEPSTLYKLAPPMTDPIILNAEILYATLIGRIIPAISLRWLCSQPLVFSCWQEAIMQAGIAANPKNAITNLMQLAAEKIDYHINSLTVYNSAPSESGQNDTKQDSILSQEKTESNLLKCLLDWLTEEIIKKDSDPQKIEYLRISEGLLVSVSMLSCFCKAYPDYQSLEKLFSLLAKVIFTKNDNPIVRYRSVHFERRDIIRGIILIDSYLNDDLKSLTIRDDFLPDSEITAEVSHDSRTSS
jgi:hypothetical protein